MKKLLFILALLPTVGFAQSIDEQISAVNNEQTRIYFQQQQEKNQAAAIAAEIVNKNAAINAENVRQAAAAHAKHAAIAAAKQAVIDAERAKWRDADREAHIAKRAAEAKLAEDSLRTDIDRKKAVNNVINSEADVNRNISEGERDRLKGLGEGAKKTSWWK